MFKYIMLTLCVFALCTQEAAFAAPLGARQILDRALESDPWGLSGARIEAKLLLRDKRGSESSLAFTALSLQYEKNLSKSVIRFHAPTELKGAAFLQIQKRSADDERFLFLPDIKRSRRVSGNLRKSSFMGTDFSYADLDRRDLRDGSASAIPDAKVGGADCYGIDVKPSGDSSEYSHIEIWIRKDNFLPMRMKMYDASSALLKTFQTDAITKVEGQWFIAKSRMTNHKQEHATQLLLESIAVAKDAPEAEFTMQALERI